MAKPKKSIPYKKTAIRMPEFLWNELTVVSERLGVSNNGLMVMWVGEKLQEEKAKVNAMTPEGIGRILSKMVDKDGEQLSLFGHPLQSETAADAAKGQEKR